MKSVGLFVILVWVGFLIIGSYYGSANAARDFPLYAELYLAGRLDLDRLISRSWSLEHINDAYEEMLGGGVARGVIEFP